MSASLSVGTLLISFGPGLLIGTSMAFGKALVAAHKDNAEKTFQIKLGGLVTTLAALGIVAFCITIHIVLAMPAFGVLKDVTMVSAFNLMCLAFVYAMMTGKLNRWL